MSVSIKAIEKVMYWGLTCMACNTTSQELPVHDFTLTQAQEWFTFDGWTTHSGKPLCGECDVKRLLPVDKD